jgi:hypothetical protein
VDDRRIERKGRVARDPRDLIDTAGLEALARERRFRRPPHNPNRHTYDKTGHTTTTHHHYPWGWASPRPPLRVREHLVAI